MRLCRTFNHVPSYNVYTGLSSRIITLSNNIAMPHTQTTRRNAISSASTGSRPSSFRSSKTSSRTDYPIWRLEQEIPHYRREIKELNARLDEAQAQYGSLRRQKNETEQFLKAFRFYDRDGNYTYAAPQHQCEEEVALRRSLARTTFQMDRLGNEMFELERQKGRLDRKLAAALAELNELKR